MSSNSDSQVQFNSEDSEIKPESLSSISKNQKSRIRYKSKLIGILEDQGNPRFPNYLLINFKLSRAMFDIPLQKGNMILKVKTGKPAETVKRSFQIFWKDQSQILQKFKKEFKKNLRKNAAILQHLGYSEQTTYLFLSNNDGDQIDLKLECVTNETKQGLLSLIRYLSPQFTYTYKVIVECFYSLLAMSQQEEDNQFNINNIVESIVEKLKSDKNHKMIFDMQLIQELLLGDYVLMNEIENEPEQAVLHLRSNEGVNLPNFTANSYKDQVESIEQYSNWINTFIREFVEILKQYQ